MNEFLAELYDTRSSIGVDEGGNDVEKLAEAEILDQFLQNEGIDVDQLDGDTILKVAHELFGDESELVKAAAEGCECDEGESCEKCSPAEDEAEKKASEADFLGRVMAHAFVQEQGAIEKQAGLGSQAMGVLEGLGKKLTPGKVTSWAGKNLPSKGRSAMLKKLKDSGMKPKQIKRIMSSDKAGKGLTGAIAARQAARTSNIHKGVGGAAAAGGAAALGGAGYAMGKKSSALDSLAEARALEILQENGIDAGGEQDKLAGSIEERAWELLVENGFVE
jgi:hypothetical protein